MSRRWDYPGVGTWFKHFIFVSHMLQEAAQRERLGHNDDVLGSIEETDTGNVAS